VYDAKFEFCHVFRSNLTSDWCSQGFHVRELAGVRTPLLQFGPAFIVVSFLLFAFSGPLFRSFSFYSYVASWWSLLPGGGRTADGQSSRSLVFPSFPRSVTPLRWAFSRLFFELDGTLNGQVLLPPFLPPVLCRFSFYLSRALARAGDFFFSLFFRVFLVYPIFLFSSLGLQATPFLEHKRGCFTVSTSCMHGFWAVSRPNWAFAIILLLARSEGGPP